jgi:uncharacterized membrane protein YfcA
VTWQLVFAGAAVAIGTDVLHGAIFETVGGLRHHRLGTTQARLSGWMLVGSAPASLLGVVTSTPADPE